MHGFGVQVWLRNQVEHGFWVLTPSLVEAEDMKGIEAAATLTGTLALSRFFREDDDDEHFYHCH